MGKPTGFLDYEREEAKGSSPKKKKKTTKKIFTSKDVFFYGAKSLKNCTKGGTKTPLIKTFFHP